MSKSTVLLVEDNDDDVELTLRSFARQNISNPVVIARNGQEALDYLYGQGSYEGRDVSQLPVLVLLDLKLPIVDGMEVLRQMRSHPQTKLIPVVILTTSLEEKDKFRTYDLGANSYVRKPVDFNLFIDAVRQLGIYWLFLNEEPPSKRPT